MPTSTGNTRITAIALGDCLRKGISVSRGFARFVLLVALAVAPASFAAESQDEATKDGGFYDSEPGGYYWYQKWLLEQKRKEMLNTPTPPPATTPDAKAPTEATTPPPMSVEWLREQLPILRDRAINEPTKNNVRAFYYAQRIMMDRAQVFSDMAQEVVSNDPLLDENLRLPFAAAAKVAFLRDADEAKKELVTELADEVALWVFYDATCAYCATQIGPLNEFAKRYGMTVEVIHKQGGAIEGLDPSIRVRADKGQFEELDINFTPSIVMVRPPKDLWVISRGFVSFTQLIDRVVAAANRFGLISEKQYLAAIPSNKGVLRADQLQHTETIDWDSPDDWVPYMQEALAETYGFDENNASGDTQ